MFTRRENEMIACLFQGLSDKEIAARMDISIRTVKQYIERTASKLLIDTRKFHRRVRIVYLLSKEPSCRIQ